MKFGGSKDLLVNKKPTAGFNQQGALTMHILILKNVALRYRDSDLNNERHFQHNFVWYGS